MRRWIVGIMAVAALFCQTDGSVWAGQEPTPMQRARQELRRARRLYVEHAISQADLDLAESSYTTTRAAQTRQEAEDNLARQKELYKNGAVTVEEVESARLKLAQATADQVKARAILPNRELQRYRALYASGALSKAELDRAERSAKRARAEVTEAEKQLRTTTVEITRSALEHARAQYRAGLIPMAALLMAEEAYENALHPIK